MLNALDNLSMRVVYSYHNFFEELKRRSISIQSLYEKYDISKGLIYRMKHGKNISVKTIVKLANTLDIDPTIIVTYPTKIDKNRNNFKE